MKGFKYSYLVLLMLLTACVSHRPDSTHVVQSATEKAVTAENNEPHTEGREIQIVDSSHVAECQYIDTVYGTSSWYGVFAEKGIRKARASAMEKAKELNATHVVWEVVPQSYGSSQVAAKVYRCTN